MTTENTNNCVISHTTQSNLKLGTLNMYLYKLVFFIFRCMDGQVQAASEVLSMQIENYTIMLIFWNIF